MGEKDAVEKTLEAYNDVFADIVNGLLFKGRQVISEYELTDAQPASSYKADGRNRIQERDVSKYWQKGSIRLTFLGLENQTAPDADMPLRVMGYDGAAYRAQLSGDGHRELYPVVTLVLYFGTECRWNSPRTLKGRLNCIPPELEPFVNDYTAHVFELAWLTDEEAAAFKGDFRGVVEFLRCQRLHVPYTGSDRQVRHIHELLELLRVISGDDRFSKMGTGLETMRKRQGGMTMYNMFQAILDQGFASGEKQGFASGEKQGFASGEKQGIAIGRDSLYALLSDLQAEGKSEELARALSDRNYMEQLLEQQPR